MATLEMLFLDGANSIITLKKIMAPDCSNSVRASQESCCKVTNAHQEEACCLQKETLNQNLIADSYKTTLRIPLGNPIRKPTVKKTVRPPNMNIIPDAILQNSLLQAAIGKLPSHYNFEIYKTVWHLQRYNSQRVALQFPEGLLMYACMIADILERFASVETVIMGDVTYGACCVDDFTAAALNCDFMVHYGHSCLIPIDTTTIRVLYVFVDIQLNLDRAFCLLLDYFAGELTNKIEMSNQNIGYKILLVGTIQFVTSLVSIKNHLETLHNFTVIIPQAKPLSPGEILGCTAPKVAEPDTYDALLYVGDGRFHLEAMMMSNPSITAYRYDPYTDILSREFYDFEAMHHMRRTAIEALNGASCIGLILSTLGRQGNPTILERLKEKCQETGLQVVVLLLSEITPEKLSQYEEGVDAWIQVACPRLSIDWGYTFRKPILSPYEASVFFKSVAYQDDYPMDFYAKHSLGPWTNYHATMQNKIQ